MTVQRTPHFIEHSVKKMAVFITGILVFLLLAGALGLVHLAIVRRLAGSELRVSRRGFAYALLIPVAVGLLFLGVGAFLEYHEQPGFCGGLCHSMEPAYETYSQPGNNSMMVVHGEADVGCTGCHVGPGWWGQVESFLVVPHEVVSEVFNTYDIDDLGGDVDPANCLKCHDGGRATLPGEVISVTGAPVDPHAEGADCAQCHLAHDGGRGTSLDTCGICHGVALPDWDDAIERHANTTGGACLDCHDRPHPEGARVPWSSVGSVVGMAFCQDCHAAERAAYVGSSTTRSLALYGECVDCHVEHDTSSAFHVVTPAYEDCASCHPGTTLPGGIHDRTGVNYAGHAAVGTDLCAGCHADQVAGLAEVGTHAGLDCTYCHQDHLAEVSVDFTKCTRCHGDDIPEWHAGDTTKCSISSCHRTGWFH
jgi:nitrate/TMAO reductase-like tetraheme cytochrome c subunit